MGEEAYVLQAVGEFLRRRNLRKITDPEPDHSVNVLWAIVCSKMRAEILAIQRGSACISHLLPEEAQLLPVSLMRKPFHAARCSLSQIEVRQRQLRHEHSHCLKCMHLVTKSGQIRWYITGGRSSL